MGEEVRSITAQQSLVRLRQWGVRHERHPRSCGGGGDDALWVSPHANVIPHLREHMGDLWLNECFGSSVCACVCMCVRVCMHVHMAAFGLGVRAMCNKQTNKTCTPRKARYLARALIRSTPRPPHPPFSRQKNDILFYKLCKFVLKTKVDTDGRARCHRRPHFRNVLGDGTA